MRLASFLSSLNLARRIVVAATVEPQDIPEVLTLVNGVAAQKSNGALFCDRVGGEISKGFTLAGRGWDAEPLPSYPTVWIHCPNGYRFKVALSAKHRDILAEDYSHMESAAA